MKEYKNTIYKLIFITIFTGCIMLVLGVFLTTYVFKKTNSVIYLDYLEKQYKKFNNECENILKDKKFTQLCKSSINKKKTISNLRYLLNDMELKYGGKFAVVATNNGNVIFSSNGDLSNTYIDSLLKILNEKIIKDRVYHSIYSPRFPWIYSIYTYKVDEDLMLNLFVEKPEWERVFPDYRFDGVITDENNKIIMTSRLSFINKKNMNRFLLEDNKYIFNDGNLSYLLNYKNLPEDNIKIYSLIYSPKNNLLLTVILFIIIILGTLWCLFVIKVSGNFAKNEAKNKEELIRRNYIAEIRELTAQINPHFMYNTLDMIKYMILYDGEKAKKILEKFTKILRYSIDNTERDITLEEDLLYIEDYLYIQKERFGDRFNAKLNINDEAKECKVLKLLLQPIIENSIKYGFMKKNKLSIKIDGYLENIYLIIIVVDDGGGMDISDLNLLKVKLLNNEIDNNHNGIHNIARRLALKYKGESGVDISNTDDGFMVKLSIRQEK